MHCNRQTQSPVAGANKNRFLLLAAVSAVALTLQTASAVPLNGGFESGDFTGWTVAIPTGESQTMGTLPAGTAAVHSSWGPFGRMADALTAPDGTYFAAIGSANNAYFMGLQTYNITARLDFTLHAGNVLSGSAAFYNGDFEAQDTARVRIFDASNNELATPWLAVSGGRSYRSASAWETWDWQAPIDGNYTVEVGVSTFGDNRFASYGFFDKVGVSTVVPVPEPSGLSLIGMGLAGLAAFNRRRAR